MPLNSATALSDLESLHLDFTHLQNGREDPMLENSRL